MTLDDLKQYSAHESAPLCSPYREWRICGPQLPSSGGVTTQQILRMLSGFELAELRDDPVTAIHLIAEASRLAFADRNLLSRRSAVRSRARRRPCSTRATSRRARRRSTSRRRYRRWRPACRTERPLGTTRRRVSAERPSTSHFSIVDRTGDAVAMTTSVQGAFGSQLMVGGFILNNQLTDFDYEPGGRRQTRREPHRRRQAAVEQHGTDARARRARPPAATRRLARRHADHRLRRSDDRRRARLRARRAAGRRGAALPRAGRADRARGRHRRGRRRQTRSRPSATRSRCAI